MADLDDIKDGKDWGRDRPADTSQFFLKGAAHHDWGMKARMARIFRPDTGRTVMLAFDHGYFQGPTTGLERLDLTIAPLVPHTDVLMGTRGGLRTSIPPESGKPVVLRCSAGNSILTELSNELVAVDIEDAIRLGAAAMAAHERRQRPRRQRRSQNDHRQRQGGDAGVRAQHLAAEAADDEDHRHLRT